MRFAPLVFMLALCSFTIPGQSESSMPPPSLSYYKVLTPKCSVIGIKNGAQHDKFSRELCDKVGAILKEKGYGRIEYLKGPPDKFVEVDRVMVGITATVQKIDGIGSVIAISGQLSREGKLDFVVPSPAYITKIDADNPHLSPNVIATLRQAITALM